MKRIILHAFSVLALLSLTTPQSEARDFRCMNVSGCVAWQPVNGKMTPHNFRYGDVISTKNGWYIDPDDEDWKRIRYPRPVGGNS
ncbi:MAG TPA: hypothetical protein ENJ09_11125 [Planctomycetes bacterium]|nr:hypothetical protein [Planctomycetota bacterium]